ncbi:hypothetical protein ANN_00882 [Periplaneta americana]|uniref:Uncharacterized protein n=1 Tax=Periplaneta americana TaxID=6978 RepID=A0ABQ8TT49_PERAM|nr:hypothetical protein ANN_00882 [Periplaneta americana]
MLSLIRCIMSKSNEEDLKTLERRGKEMSHGSRSETKRSAEVPSQQYYCRCDLGDITRGSVRSMTRGRLKSLLIHRSCHNIVMQSRAPIPILRIILFWYLLCGMCCDSQFEVENYANLSSIPLHIQLKTHHPLTEGGVLSATVPGFPAFRNISARIYSLGALLRTLRHLGRAFGMDPMLLGHLGYVNLERGGGRNVNVQKSVLYANAYPEGARRRGRSRLRWLRDVEDDLRMICGELDVEYGENGRKTETNGFN